MEDKRTKEIQQNANSTSALETQLISALEKQLIEQTRQLEEIEAGIEKAAVVRAPMEFPIPNSPHKNKTDGRGPNFTGSRKQYFDCIIS